MQRNTSFPLLLLCFFLSGLAGLIYQTAWTREFAFVFGTSNLAIATVLSAYMAGLAAGAGLAARFADRIRRPLLSYGVLELGVGLTALCVPFAIHASQVLYVAILGGRSDLPESGGLATAIFYLICSSLILMVPTAMMGATLPLLVRHSVYNEQQIGSRIGLLYAINTAGAVVGTLLAAFWLLPTLGLRQTIWAAAGVNGLVFLAAWALARSSEGQSSRSSRVAEPQDAHGLGGSRWVLPLIFGSGFVSFTYEVLWTRLLDHLLGGSVYAFASMLASFLLGISIGAGLASRYCRSREQAGNGFVIAQVAIALLSAVAFELIDQVPSLVNSLTAAGVSPRLVEAMASLLVLLPPATAIGATFPFAVRILARGQHEAGAASAKVYAGNTSGSVLGAVAAGFFIVPALGFSGTLGACVAANLGLAAAAAGLFQLRFRYRRGLQIACTIVAVTFLVAPPELPWRVLRYSPIRHVSSMLEDVEYFEVGRAATVLLLETATHWHLRTNGLPEGHIRVPGIRPRRAGAAPWLGALPTLARPEARSILIVGLGAGVAVETVPSAIDRIDVIELEPAVVEANRIVADRRWRDPLSDPRLRLHLNDARNALRLTDQRFDAIASQPSHPWSAGASHLYTREFFQLVEQHLTPNGVFVQWIGAAFVDEALFRTLLASLVETFEYVRVYNPAGDPELLFLASNEPIEVEQTAARALADSPEDFERLGLFVPEDVNARLLLDEAAVRELAGAAPVNRDDHNLLQLRSPQIFDRSLVAGLGDLVSPYEPILDARRHDNDNNNDNNSDNNSDNNNDFFYLLQIVPAARAIGIVDRIEEGVDREVAQAMLDLAAGRRQTARQRLIEVLEGSPRHVHARAQLLDLSSYSLGRGQNPLELLEEPLDEPERIVLEGWKLSAAGDHEGMRSLDTELATLSRLHPLAPRAAELRAEWRIALADRPLAEEAVRIIDRASWGFRRPEWFLLRARASAAAGDTRAALDSIARVIEQDYRGRRVSEAKALARRSNKFLQGLPRDAELERFRSQVEVGLQRLESL